MKKMNKIQKGFTLIELLAVILILGIIALIAIPTVNNIIKGARDSANMRNAEGYYKAIQNRLSIGMLNNDKISNEIYSTKDFSDLEYKGTAPDDETIIVQNHEVIGLELNYKNTLVIIDRNGKSSVIKNKVYGLKLNEDGSYTRLNDAKDMSSCVGTDTDACMSDFDNAEIYSEIKDVDGNAFVYIPKFYIKKVVNQNDGKNIWEWYISKEKKDDNYYLPECFHDIATNKELPYVLIGKYDASLDETGTKLESKSETLPLVSKSITLFRNYALANNTGSTTGYQLLDIHMVDIIQTLFYIEFGTLNSQKIMKGYTYGKSPYDDKHKVVSVNDNNILITSGAGSSYKVGQ